VATLLAVSGAGLGLTGVGHFVNVGSDQRLIVPWSVPGGEFAVGLDHLSALFLVPIFLISLLGSVYGLSYWTPAAHPENSRKLRLFYGTLTGAMALLVLARNSIVFLFGWEIMALSAFFLVTTVDHDQEVRETGWLYLIATHIATLCLFALFALLRATTGSYTLAPFAPDAIPASHMTAVFLLALAGFGLKAGIMPLHVWLPSSHAIAPSHVSAIMSGVIIKMGIYGFLRIVSLCPETPLWWGEVVLALGVVSGVFGVAFAIGQHDLKRLLAYHSIENIGIIVMGIGLALVGRSLGQPAWVVLGLSGALLHVWNHALFKALLFLSAGSVIHAVHTREIDHLGGLARYMPWTALGFLIGAVAICGLPPLNGFVSELLIYLGLFHAVSLRDQVGSVGVALAVSALALIGTLALVCFVKVYGAMFLGKPRSAHAQPDRSVHDPGPTMLVPMFVLAAGCFLIGLAPGSAAPLLDNAVSAWAPGVSAPGIRLVELAPLGWVTVIGLTLVALTLASGFALGARLRRSEVQESVTWDCGYAAPSARMQYTSSSFAQMIVNLFRWVLWPRKQAPRQLDFFPAKAHFHSEIPDTVLDRAVWPSFQWGARFFARLRVLQTGSIQLYLLYIFLVLLALLICC
jgi:hydrogenase-4 component B